MFIKYLQQTPLCIKDKRNVNTCHMLTGDDVPNLEIFAMGCSDWVLGRKMAIHLCKEDKWSSSCSRNMHNGTVFPDPRFVSAHLIPESDNPEDDKIYFFFRENAIDGEHTGKATHARIGQICKVRWWLLVIQNALASNFRNCVFSSVNYSVLTLALY